MSRTLNVVDADGHVLEPLYLWVRYVDPKFRGRAKPFVDENRRDWISIDGKVLGGIPGIGLSRIGAIGVAKEDIPKMKYTYGEKFRILAVTGEQRSPALRKTGRSGGQLTDASWRCDQQRDCRGSKYWAARIAPHGPQAMSAKR